MNEMTMTFPSTVEVWDCFEIRIAGPMEGNPFQDQWVAADFEKGNLHYHVDGFYDGDGQYLIRFMPMAEGIWHFRTETSFRPPAAGSFSAGSPGPNNHGMARVSDTYHFAYEDGTPLYPIGTTCYVWNWQSDELISKTLDSLAGSSFRKIRFCVFPKHYDYNLHEPRSYPFPGEPMDSSVLTEENFWQYTGKTEGNHWDFTRFNPVHFRHLDRCIQALMGLGIEADLILFHPYDRWGFSCMPPETDAFYLQYVAARYGAYRNVWWSMANEYDLCGAKTLQDWENLAACLVRADPYGHLRSIHNCVHLYDYTRPWITHCSVQRTDLYKSSEMTEQLRARYRKPVVLDEIAYEGNIQHGWGNIPAKEMVRRLWEGAVRGGYPGHSETWLGHDGVLWWSHGGALQGESHLRVGFLMETLRQTPGNGLRPKPDTFWDEVCGIPEGVQFDGDYYLYYYSFMQPSFRDFRLDERSSYEVHILDTWEMTRTRAGVYSGTFRIHLPGKEGMAIQIRRISGYEGEKNDG